MYFAASAGDVVVSGNTINDPLETATNAGGIWLTHANGDVEVNGNTITMVQSGITLNNTGNGTLELDGNEIVGVTNGILFTGSGTGAASISGNDLRGFEQQGISIIESNSTNLQITNNSFSSTYDGALPVSFNLATYNSDLSVLTGNAFTGFAYNAIGIHGTMQRNLSFTGNLCVSFDLDLNGHTLNVSDTLSVVAGDVLVNGGTLNVGSYIQSEGMKLVLNSNNDVKNVHVSESFLIDDWSDIQFGNNVTVNVNTYVTGDHTVLNGPGTNYWAPSNPDTLHGTFAKGIWQENSYCYIEYPIYNASGTVTEYRRGYVPYANVFGSFVPNHDIRVTAYVQDGHVYNLPSTESQIVGTFYGYIEVSIIDEENDMVYVEYQYDRYGAKKRGYVLETQLFDAATAIELLDDTVTLYLGGEYQLNVQFTPSNAKNKEVAWSCEPSNVITISDSGVITAIGLGTATVTAKAKVGGATDTCTVKVEELALTESNVTMVAGQTHQLRIALLPGPAGNQEITFSSDNPSVATVDPVSGLVTAIKAGTATITARTNEGVTASCTFTINQNPDPFHPTNVKFIRYTKITTSSTSHLLSVVATSSYSYDIFIVTNEINGATKAYVISDELKNELKRLEEGYHNHLIPALHCSLEEGAAHAAKEETDQLVSDGFITGDSTEYFGAWASNFEAELEIINKWTVIFDQALAAYGVYLSISSMYAYITSGSKITISSTQYSNLSSELNKIDDALGGIQYTNRTVIPAETRNAALAAEGYKNPYKIGSPTVGFSQSNSTQYVRVYTEGSTSPTGKWLMKYSDIQGLTPAQIQSKFALKYEPTHYCYVDVPSGTQLYVGIVGENFGYIAGEAVQFELVNLIPPSSFGPGIPLS